MSSSDGPIDVEPPEPPAPDKTMFGYSDAALNAARRRRERRESRLFRWWVVLLELLVLVVAGAVGGVAWLLEHPAYIQTKLDEATASAKFRISFEDIEVLPRGSLWEPASWRIAVVGLRFEPNDPTKTEFRIERVTVAPPDLRLAYEQRHLHFRWARVVGLAIQAHQQRPPPEWQVQPGELAMISADVVDLWDASFDAPEDPPIGAAHVDRIYGRIDDVRYHLPRRELTGIGSLWAPEFTTASITVTDVDLPVFRAEASNAFFEGQVMFQDTPTTITAELLNFHRKPEVTLGVAFQDAPVEAVVEVASGERSPLVGHLDADLIVHAGGVLPRGGAWMEGDVSLTEARIPLGKDVGNFIKDIIRIAPWLKLSSNDAVALGDMTGRIRLNRGSVDIWRLTYQAPKRQIELHGHIDPEDLMLVLRLVPKKDPEKKPGLGLVMYGTPEKYQFRVAKKEDLLPDVFGLDDSSEPKETRVRKPLFVLGKKKGKNEQAEEEP